MAYNRFIALLLQEALELSQKDICAALSVELADMYPGEYAYVCDIFGTADSGEVVFYCASETWRAPYEIGLVDGKRTTAIDDDLAVEVMPRTIYDVKADGVGTSEAGKHVPAGTLKLLEFSDWAKDAALSLVEASGSVRMPIKLIAPGKGSSAFYPAEVLKRDGPGVFTKGTHIYINHATSAEEAARPEGDWHKLAGALESNAYYDEAGKAGPGLYGNALFTSDYAPLIKEKAAFTGMSIRASGVAEADKTRDGVPVLKQLTGAESVDVVTRAGAGGMILTEAARTANSQQESTMTDEEIKKLVESAVTSAVTAAVAAVQTPVVSLTERALRGDAREEATKILEPVTLPESAKRKIIETVLRETLPLKDGALDVKTFTDRVNAEAKSMGEVLAEATGSGRVFGLGNAPTTQLSEADAKLARETAAQRLQESTDVFLELMGDEKAAKFAARGRAA